MAKTRNTLKNRIQWVDNLRGIAIILMVIFHFCYDLRYFGWVNWDVPNGGGWWQFRYVILSLFIFTMGLSLSLAHHKQFKLRKFLIRISQLAIAAILVSAMSLFMFPDSWIYFGILHFLFTASIIGILFIRQVIFALLLGISILVLHGFDIANSGLPFSFFNHYIPDNTEDFVPFFPWLGVCLIGVAAGQLLPLKKIDNYFPKFPNSVNFLGRHGLVIYILHQPVLFAVLIPLSQFL